MSANKATDTKPEIILRQALWHSGIRGYRLHWRKVPGRPDIAYPSRKLAIFVNGCFWHRCPTCNLPLPKNNQDFWQLKFQKNVERDVQKVAELVAMGWEVMTVWECEIKDDLPKVIRYIQKIHNDLGSTDSTD
jgi:DNA mismatch endonuclease (patch repair protein)